ncbi:TonB-dependent receptor [Asticcacaulis sp. ZE23SCel15]|uniref:TonB-dependent receptor n=1 Tax=Asticcacaulis sp. ZE23SCel15 TaxID=3059027 RepID=UPI00265D6E38|nr:TonB-dependent receptor [Asticcacaulis sp. ZE23SCel15]WKL56085.1 TonB-dependent receptor [Asticcacaulis sp. ZE23SCel15]
MTFKHYALVSTALTGLLMASVATAQDQIAATTSADAPVEEVVVTGFRKSLASALKAKQNDIRVTDGISSEDIGKFPSENIAEAIQRIPGVQISNINGRGSTISVRGLGPQYSATTINGQTFKSADFTDGFRYDVIQTELASGIQVIKSPTADMDAGGLAGTINIDTTRPLDVKGRKLVISAKGQKSQNAEGDIKPKVGINYIDQFAGGKLGLSLGGSYQELEDRGDYFWMDRWTVTSAGVYTPARPRFRRIERESERLTLNAGVQYKPTDSLALDFSAIYAKDDTFQDLNQQVFLFTSPSAANVVTNEVSGNTATKVTVSNYRLENNHQIENRELTTEAYTGSFKYTGFEDWLLKGTLHYTHGRSIFNEAAAILGVNIGSSVFDMSDPENIIFTVSNDLNDATLYNPATLFRNTYPVGAYRTTDTDETAYQFDAKRYLDWGIVTSVDMGIKSREETLYRNVYRIDRMDNVPAASASDLADDSVTVDSFLDGEMSVPRGWISADMEAYMAAQAAEGVTVPRAFDPQGSFRVEREVKSVYIMANLKGEVFGREFRGNVGLRNEMTDQTVFGNIASSANNPINSNVRLAVGTYETPKKYSNVLPSANFTFDLAENLLLRVAAAEVLVRPILNSSNPLATTVSTSVDSTGTTNYAISLGQGDLDPLTAEQLDIGLEWYYGAGNGLSLSAFQKKVKNGTYSTSVCPASYEGATLSRDSSGVCNGSDGAVYTITQTLNDASIVTIEGFEINWQQSFDMLLPIDGFGVMTNYTHVTPSSSKTGFKLANLSENTANVTGYWENSTFSARVSANYRSEFDQSSVESFFSGPLGHTVEARTQVDVNLGYTINEKLSLSFAAMNINNAQEKAYLLDKDRWQMTSVTGPSYYLSFQYKM